MRSSVHPFPWVQLSGPQACECELPTNHNRAQINRSHPCINQFCVLVIYLSGKHGDISALHQSSREGDVQYEF